MFKTQNGKNKKNDYTTCTVLSLKGTFQLD